MLNRSCAYGNNEGQDNHMRLEPLIYGLLILSAIVVGMFGVFDGMADQYGEEVNTTRYTENLDDIDEEVESINQSIGTLTDSQLSISDFLGGLGLVWSVINIIIIVPMSVSTSIVSFFAVELGLPVWFVGLLLGSLTVGVLFALIGLILRWRA